MDFAKRQLAKYGWKEGDGLGKDKSGINEPIKPKLKKDLTGIGYEPEKAFNWWEYAFNKAAENIVVEKEGSEHVVVQSKGDLEISTSRSRKRKSHNIIERKFFKEGECEETNTNSSEVDIDNYLLRVSDDSLLKICGGRTLHKGARHGLNLSGKLARLAKQENLSSTAEGASESFKTKSKKKKKRKKENAE